MKTIKPLLLILAFFGFIFSSNAQNKSRQSPPATAMNKVADVSIKVDYSQPSVKDRTIWGDLVPYEKVWRTGANEATTIEFSKDVSVDGKKISAGKYALFTIPGPNEWIVT